jgi:pyridinium-3,5-biscarboxylic acid mononucleotide sulfurtransferase
VLSGANADDVGDWRPGLVAAREHDVIHPLLEAGVTKAQVRDLARALGVPSAEKVASPCLASRVPHGTPVDPQVLRQIDAAEQAVRALGYRVLRVRHHGDLGKLELAADELERALEPGQRAAIAAAIRSAGYARTAIDLEPFRSGSLTAAFRGRMLNVLEART